MATNRHPEIHLALLAVLSGLLCFAPGCAGPIFYQPEIQTPGPLAPGMSRIIFFRRTNSGFTTRTSIFEVVEGDIRLAGVVEANQKTFYDVVPGKRLFMVVGRNADFMSAQLEEGKTYYAEVVPEDTAGELVVVSIFEFLLFPLLIGSDVGRFDLRPIHKSEMDTGGPGEWLAGCEWAMLSEPSSALATQNRSENLQKFHKRLSKTDQAGAGPPGLESGDGFIVW